MRWCYGVYIRPCLCVSLSHCHHFVVSALRWLSPSRTATGHMRCAPQSHCNSLWTRFRFKYAHRLAQPVVHSNMTHALVFVYAGGCTHWLGGDADVAQMLCTYMYLMCFCCVVCFLFIYFGSSFLRTHIIAVINHNSAHTSWSAYTLLIAIQLSRTHIIALINHNSAHTSWSARCESASVQHKDELRSAGFV
jgi:hypothetical protein